jgi:hypothetical protein
MNTFCTTCGTPLAPETKFCGNCGTGTTAPPPVPPMAVPYPPPLPPLSNALEPPPPIAPGTLPSPPSLHWSLVTVLPIALFVFAVLASSETPIDLLGCFLVILLIVQGLWLKRLTGDVWPLIGVGAVVLVAFLATAYPALTDGVGGACFGVLYIMRNGVLKHYNSVEPIDLKIPIWKLALGNGFYFQVCLNRIAKLKREQPERFAPYVTPIPFDTAVLGRFQGWAEQFRAKRFGAKS